MEIMATNYKTDITFHRVGGAIHQTIVKWEIDENGNPHYKDHTRRVIALDKEMTGGVDTLTLMEEGLAMAMKTESYEWVIIYMQRIITLRIERIIERHCL